MATPDATTVVIGAGSPASGSLRLIFQLQLARARGEQQRKLTVPSVAFVAAHHSFPQDPEGRERWLGRFAAHAAGSGMPIDQARNAAAGIEARLPVMSPHDDEALFREAGFTAVELFYAALTFRGWVAFA